MQLSAQNPVTGKTEIFIVKPFVADQELTGKVGGVGYWEGACRVLDENKKEIGRAYMELTGYGESLNGKFCNTGAALNQVRNIHRSWSCRRRIR